MQPNGRGRSRSGRLVVVGVVLIVVVVDVHRRYLEEDGGKISW